MCLLYSGKKQVIELLIEVWQEEKGQYTAFIYLSISFPSPKQINNKEWKNKCHGVLKKGEEGKKRRREGR